MICRSFHFPLLLISNFITLWSDICENLFSGLSYYLSWERFHVHLTRICILLVLCGILCIYQLHLIVLKCGSIPLFPCQFSVWMNYSLLRVMNPPVIIVLSISHLRSIINCVIYFSAQVLGMYIFMIIVSS